MRSLVVILVAGIIVGAVAGQDGLKAKLPPGVPEFVPDPSWVARPGERGNILRATVAGTTAGNYWSYAKADRVGIEALMSQGGLVRLEAGDEVHVIRDFNPKPVSRVMSTESFLNSVATAGGREPSEDAGVEVRILSGKHKDKSLVLASSDVGRLFRNPRPWLPLKVGSAVVLVDPAAPIAADMETYRRIRSGGPEEANDAIGKKKAFRVTADDKITVNEIVADRKTKTETDAAKVRVVGKGQKSTRYGVVYRGNLAPVPVTSKK